MVKAMLGKVPLSRWQGLRDDLENKVAGPNGERWADDLGIFLRKEPRWLQSRHNYGESRWVLGRVRVDHGEADRRGCWVNGIYRESKLIWFTNHLFFYACTSFYDKKSFDLLEYHESTWPAWDSTTFKGFCTSLCSQEFGNYLLGYQLSDMSRIRFTLEGSPTKDEGARFNFSTPHGPKEIMFALPETKNGIFLMKELWEAARKELLSTNGQLRLRQLTEG